MEYVKYIPNKRRTAELNKETELFNKSRVAEVYKFHLSMGAAYNETPLVKLESFADELNLKSLYVKDESKRGDLKAFKLLGGSYAVANLICEKLGVDINDIDFDYLKSDEVKQKLGDITFAAASDGNHGKSVAWAANAFNQKSIVYMPKGTAKDRIDAIENLGGEVVVSDYNYDWCVSYVNKSAQEKGWEVVLDTISEGEAEAPIWVMQGYTTMAHEAIMQLDGKVPTHIFLQAGVGSMAAAVTAVFANYYLEKCPNIYILEPHQAACYYKSAEADDGMARSVEGDMDSIMAGLACGVPNPISWEIIKSFAAGFFSCDDVLTANGMRILANPKGTDSKIISGESGAIGTGFLDYIMRYEKGIAEKIGLNEKSSVLLFSTEGDTDRVNYTDIVWYGKYNFK